MGLAGRVPPPPPEGPPPMPPHLHGQMDALAPLEEGDERGALQPPSWQRQRLEPARGGEGEQRGGRGRLPERAQVEDGQGSCASSRAGWCTPPHASIPHPTPLTNRG